MITIKLMTLITIILTIMLIVIINKNLEGGGKFVSTFQGILIFCCVILGRHACLYPIVISAGLSQSSLFVMAYFWGDMRACLYPIVISAGFVMSFLVTNACLYPIVIIYLQVRHVLPDEVPP